MQVRETNMVQWCQEAWELGEQEQHLGQAMQEQMDATELMICFEHHNPNYNFSKIEESWMWKRCED